MYSCFFHSYRSFSLFLSFTLSSVCPEYNMIGFVQTNNLQRSEKWKKNHRNSHMYFICWVWNVSNQFYIPYKIHAHKTNYKVFRFFPHLLFVFVCCRVILDFVRNTWSCDSTFNSQQCSMLLRWVILLCINTCRSFFFVVVKQCDKKTFNNAAIQHFFFVHFF